MCKTRLLTFRGLLRNVKAIWISAKNVVYLYSEEERARKHRVLSSFFCKNRAKMGCFTKHLEKFICLRKISTCFSGFFSGQVGAQIDDIDTSKVKRYLFFIPAFFSFQVTTQVAHCGLGMLFCAPRRGKLLVAQGRAKRRPGYCRPSPPFALQGQKRKNQRLLFVHTLHLLWRNRQTLWGGCTDANPKLLLNDT